MPHKNFYLDAFPYLAGDWQQTGGLEMRFPIGTRFVTMVVVATGVHAQAATRPHSNTLRVETPANHPALAEANAEAIYLHKTGDGRALLYIEQQKGRGLSVLDVTDPANVKRVANRSFPNPSTFEFVRNVNDDAALIRYENGSGFAVLNFKHSRHPVLEATPVFAEATNPEMMLGQTGMLVTVAQNSTNSAADPKTYQVLDTANASGPGLMATIPDVTQREENSDTGTLFLLNRDGVTMIRRPRVEAEYQAELSQSSGN
jgi:hypothetical protein